MQINSGSKTRAICVARPTPVFFKGLAELDKPVGLKKPFFIIGSNKGLAKLPIQPN
jgi:hypothetical protein